MAPFCGVIPRLFPLSLPSVSIIALTFPRRLGQGRTSPLREGTFLAKLLPAIASSSTAPDWYGFQTSPFHVGQIGAVAARCCRLFLLPSAQEFQPRPARIAAGPFLH